MVEFLIKLYRGPTGCLKNKLYTKTVQANTEKNMKKNELI